MLERTKKRRTEKENGDAVDTDTAKDSFSGKAMTVNEVGAAFKRGAVSNREMTANSHVFEAKGDSRQIQALKAFAKRIGLKLRVKEPSELIALEVVMPEVRNNRSGVCLRGARVKEDMTQIELAKSTGISQRHISEMENGKRPIGKESAKKFAEVLKVDYRVFL